MNNISFHLFKYILSLQSDSGRIGRNSRHASRLAQIVATKCSILFLDVFWRENLLFVDMAQITKRIWLYADRRLLYISYLFCRVFSTLDRTWSLTSCRNCNALAACLRMAGLCRLFTRASRRAVAPLFLLRLDDLTRLAAVYVYRAARACE